MNCSKRQYRTEKDAELSIETIHSLKFSAKREKHPIRYYLCDYCKYYHLTSKPANAERVELIHVLSFKALLKRNRKEKRKRFR